MTLRRPIPRPDQFIEKEFPMTYVATLCKRCKKPIGHSPYRSYFDIETQMTFLWHVPECWDAIHWDCLREFIQLIFRAKRR